MPPAIIIAGALALLGGGAGVYAWYRDQQSATSAVLGSQNNVDFTGANAPPVSPDVSDPGSVTIVASGLAAPAVGPAFKAAPGPTINVPGGTTSVDIGGANIPINPFGFNSHTTIVQPTSSAPAPILTVSGSEILAPAGSFLTGIL